MTKDSISDDVVEAIRDPDRLRAVETTGLLTARDEAPLDRVTSLASEILDIPTMYVSLIGDGGELIKSCAGDDPCFEVGDELSLRYSLGKHVVTTGQRLVIDDASEHPVFKNHEGRSEYDIGTFVGIPLKSEEGDVLGAFVALGENAREWSDREIDLLESFAESARTELALRRHIQKCEDLEEKLRQEALYDSLTGLASRELLTDRLAHAVDRAERTGVTLAVLYLDLDDFRDVNVALGRDAGDDLLVQTSEHLASEARDQDSLGRLGRDEFALVLEDVEDRDQVAQIARRIHDTVATTVNVGDSAIECRASIGYVLTNPENEIHGIPAVTDPDRLLRMAEEAMHAAKSRGVPYVNATEAQLSN